MCLLFFTSSLFHTWLFRNPPEGKTRVFPSLLSHSSACLSLYSPFFSVVPSLFYPFSHHSHLQQFLFCSWTPRWLLSMLQNFFGVSLPGWMAATSGWGKSVRTVLSFRRCHPHGKRTGWTSRGCSYCLCVCFLLHINLEYSRTRFLSEVWLPSNNSDNRERSQLLVYLTIPHLSSLF